MTRHRRLGILALFACRLTTRSFLALVLVTLGAISADAAPFVYVTNAGWVSSSVSVIDTATNTVVATVPLPGTFGPEGVAITPNGAFAYVTNFDSFNVSVIDAATNTVVTTVPVDVGPWGVAITPDGAFAYVANYGGGNVSVIDTATNTVVATVPVVGGLGAPSGVAITPNGAFAYVTLGDGSVSVIATATNTEVAKVASAIQTGVAITPDGAFAYVTTDVIDTATNTVVATVPVSGAPSGVAITPNGAFAYVTTSPNSISVINTRSNIVVDTVTVGSSPGGVAITPDGAFAYVANFNSSNVSVIDTATNTIVATVPLPVGSFPLAVAITPLKLPVAPAATLSPTSFDFGNQTITGQGPTTTFVLAAKQDIQITSVTTSSSDYIVGNQCPAALLANGMCTITVTFQPGALGTSRANLIVTGSFGSSLVATLRGIGVYPAMSESPHSLSYGNQIVGSSSVPQTVILSNTGTASLQFNAIYTTGDFSETTACSSPLVPGASCSISVVFTPTARYARTGTLVISSSQISQTDTVTLSGTGTVAIAQLSPGSLNFGNQRVNTSSASQNVTLLNTGDGPLTLSTIFTTGPYSQANNCSSSIAPGTRCNIAVIFTPRVRGTVNGTLSITGNQQGSAPVTTLAGTGR